MFFWSKEPKTFFLCQQKESKSSHLFPKPPWHLLAFERSFGVDPSGSSKIHLISYLILAVPHELLRPKASRCLGLLEAMQFGTAVAAVFNSCGATEAAGAQRLQLPAHSPRDICRQPRTEEL